MGNNQSGTEMGNNQSGTEEWASGQRITWTYEGRDDLIESIKTNMNENNDEKLNILILGELGSGKSSLGDGFITALRKQKIVSNYFSEGGGLVSGTKVLHVAKLGNVNLIDAPGFLEWVDKKLKDRDTTKDTANGEDEDITAEAIRAIVEGRVPFYALLNKFLQIENPGQLGKPVPYNQNAVCVVIVMKHGEDTSDHVIQQIKFILQLAGKGANSYRVVLTHVDKLDSKFKDKKKLQSVHHSKAVQRAVFNIAQKIGVPLKEISVVRNYSVDVYSDLYSDILFLQALNLIISSARDQAEKVATRKCISEWLGDVSASSAEA